MTTLNAIANSAARAAVGQHDHASIDDAVQIAYGAHADEIRENAEAMVHQSLRTAIKKALGSLTDDDGTQLCIPGLSLPTAIAVRQDDGSFAYVRSDKAHWNDLVAGRAVRAENVTAATAKLDQFDRDMVMLAPYMEADPSVTVAEAVRRASTEAAA